MASGRPPSDSIYSKKCINVIQAFDTARSFNTAQEHSVAYLTEKRTTAVASELQSKNINSNSDQSNNIILGTVSPTKICYFCGFSFHQ